jgi:hypothetical protein
MATRMQQRRGTASAWVSANTVLTAGELGYETDTGQFKIGDGTTAWLTLPYFKDTLDLDIAGKAPINSPTFTGTVVLPSTTSIADVSAAEIAVLNGITSTTAELNILDGVTANASELNRLDGLLASTAELNVLVGITSTSAELNILDGATLSVSELNVLDGVTASTAELNILDGVTSTAAELNILDGATLSTTELNYVDGVTSAIQTQIDNKASLAGATFTGNVEMDGNLIVDGDFTVNGTNFSASATTITIEDNLIQLAHQNAANTVDLGIVVGYNDGSAKHSGIVRDVSDDKWKLFKGVTTEPTTTVNFGQGSLDTLAVATLETSGLTASGAVNFTGATITGLASLPSQTGNNGKYLTTDGSAASWATVNATPALDDITDVTLTSSTANDVVYYNGTGWVNKYVASIPTLTNAQSGTTYTLVLGDAGKIVEVGNASAITLTVPTNAGVAYPVGTQITILQTGAGQITVTGPAGGTLNATPGTKLRAQWSSATLLKRATDTWVLIGDLTA